MYRSALRSSRQVAVAASSLRAGLTVSPPPPVNNTPLRINGRIPHQRRTDRPLGTQGRSRRPNCPIIRRGQGFPDRSLIDPRATYPWCCRRGFACRDWPCSLRRVRSRPPTNDSLTETEMVSPVSMACKTCRPRSSSSKYPAISPGPTDKSDSHPVSRECA